MYKTYIMGIIMILFGVFGFIIDLYEGRSPEIDKWLEYILIGAGLIGLRQAIKKK